MGYYTRFTGNIDIRPPLRWAEIRDTDWIDPSKWPDLLIDVHEQREETADGEQIVKEGRAIVPLTDESYKGYDVVDTLTRIVSAFPDHEYVGEIRCEGEEAGDIRRLLVKDGEVVEWKAQLAWPDGTVETTR